MRKTIVALKHFAKNVAVTLDLSSFTPPIARCLSFSKNSVEIPFFPSDTVMSRLSGFYDIHRLISSYKWTIETTRQNTRSIINSLAWIFSGFRSASPCDHNSLYNPLRFVASTFWRSPKTFGKLLFFDSFAQIAIHLIRKAHHGMRILCFFSFSPRKGRK